MIVSEEQPFVDIWCAPSYHRRCTIVDWTLPDIYKTGRIYVYRSLTGTPPWECLNPNDPVLATGSFEDTTLAPDNRAQLAYYRLMLEHDNVRYRSPAVHLLQKMSRSQYGGVRKMLIEELRRMRAGQNGLQMYHVPLVKDQSDKDLLTGQTFTLPCPSDPLTGYGSPVLTWVELGPQQIEMQDRPEGDGSDTTVRCSARFLNFPRPLRGHVFIDVTADDRYVVDKVVEAHKFRGIIPISYSGILLLLPRDDPRYRIQVPSILPS